MSQGTHEILVLGSMAKQEGATLLNAYIPNKVVMLSNEIVEQYPLMKHKHRDDTTAFYVCKDYTCQLPFNNLTDLMSFLLTK
jgi:uncharacterized protein YyaL (SSP411 family)